MCFIEPEAAGLFRRQIVGAGLAGAAAAGASVMLPGLAQGAEPTTTSGGPGGIGSETHGNVLRAAGVPEKQIVQVKGGEHMQFDGYTIEVFPGLHSMGPIKKYAVPGHLVTVPASAPSKVGEMPEGDTLIYLITI